MKATSKLISVVLILAMCLSLFTVSAFADSSVIIGGAIEPSQAGGMQRAVLQKTQGQTKSGVGGVGVDFRLFVVLFGVGRFLLWCGSAVVLFRFWKTLKG